jgi:hypothetical protein
MSQPQKQLRTKHCPYYLSMTTFASGIVRRISHPSPSISLQLYSPTRIEAARSVDAPLQFKLISAAGPVRLVRGVPFKSCSANDSTDSSIIYYAAVLLLILRADSSRH